MIHFQNGFFHSDDISPIEHQIITDEIDRIINYCGYKTWAKERTVEFIVRFYERRKIRLNKKL